MDHAYIDANSIAERYLDQELSSRKSFANSRSISSIARNVPTGCCSPRCFMRGTGKGQTKPEDGGARGPLQTEAGDPDADCRRIGDSGRVLSCGRLSGQADRSLLFHHFKPLLEHVRMRRIENQAVMSDKPHFMIVNGHQQHAKLQHRCRPRAVHKCRPRSGRATASGCRLPGRARVPVSGRCRANRGR